MPRTRQRLDELVWSHFDNMFGRNPVGRHFSFDAPREVEGVEYGWFKFYHGGIGRFADARFVIDGTPKNAHYPYHPEVGDIGWTEGWIQFNVCLQHQPLLPRLERIESGTCADKATSSSSV